MKKTNLILITTFVLILALILVVIVLITLKYESILMNEARTINGNGKIVSQAIETENFDRITVNRNFHITFKQDTVRSVILKTDSALLKIVDVRVENSSLIIETIDNLPIIVKDKMVSVEISNPDLIEVNASAGATFYTKNRVNVPMLIISGNSGSSIKIDGIIDSLFVTQNSGSQINISGKGHLLDTEANTGSNVDAREFEAEKARVTANTGSNIFINARQLNITATTGSRVTYIGTPTISEMSLNSGASATSINE